MWRRPGLKVRCELQRDGGDRVRGEVIDILVQRFAKTGAAGLKLVLVGYLGTGQVHWLSFASILVLVLWIGVIRFAGRRFDQLARGRKARFGETEFRRTRRNRSIPLRLAPNSSPWQ